VGLSGTRVIKNPRVPDAFFLVCDGLKKLPVTCSLIPWNPSVRTDIHNSAPSLPVPAHSRSPSLSPTRVACELVEYPTLGFVAFGVWRSVTIVRKTLRDRSSRWRKHGADFVMLAVYSSM